MDNATMLYRAPGAHQIHGHAVDYTIVDEPQIDEHLAAGWFRTAVDAGEAWLKQQAASAEKELEEAEDKVAATLEEAHQKLDELGVTFDRRLGLKKLLKLIEDTLAGKKDTPPDEGDASAENKPAADAPQG